MTCIKMSLMVIAVLLSTAAASTSSSLNLLSTNTAHSSTESLDIIRNDSPLTTIPQSFPTNAPLIRRANSSSALPTDSPSYSASATDFSSEVVTEVPSSIPTDISDLSTDVSLDIKNIPSDIPTDIPFDITSVPSFNPTDIPSDRTANVSSINSTNNPLDITVRPSGMKSTSPQADETPSRVPEKSPKRVPTKAGQIVKCHCQGNEILKDGVCQQYPKGLKINFEENYRFTVLKDVADFNVTVHNLICDVENDYRQIEFTKDEFRIRDRGDAVILEAAGELNGLRVNNYCIIHYLDEGEPTWRMKACVNPPNVPRCCVAGQAMIDGTCQPANTPRLLTPPITAKPFSNKPVFWPVIKNYHNPINCSLDLPLTEIPLGKEDSHLISLHTGLLHGWIPPEKLRSRKYTYLPKYCVDAKEKDDKSVSYSTYLCYSNPEERFKEICEGHVCVHKCCPEGEVMSAYLFRCIPNNTVSFVPPFTSLTTPEYKTVIGWPLCSPQTQVKKFALHSDGYLEAEGIRFPPDEYCTDIFIDREHNLATSALACMRKLTTWEVARDYVFPVCQVTSLVFVVLTLLCYLTVPALRKNSGWYQVCHLASLFFAYASGFILQIFNDVILGKSCIVMALILQFGFIGTFLWLNVLCFEVWRKIRSLARMLPSKPIKPWVYPVYAWGLALTIGIITCIMQYLAPENVPGVYKPHLGINRCWFYGDLELLLYFYGPIAFLFVCNFIFIGHTFWIYRTLDNNSDVLKKLGSEMSARNQQRKRDYAAEFKQQFSLLVLMCCCWVTEILSWKIPPPELWATTDVLNSLQGFFVFIILMANRTKRRHLRKKYSKPFEIGKHCSNGISKVKDKLMSTKGIAFITSQVSRKVSTSSIVSNISTLTTSLKASSKHSFNLGESSKQRIRTSVSLEEDPDNGIITLYHSQLSSSSSSCENLSSC